MFEHRTTDHPTTTRCAMCGHEVPIPTDEPWIIAGDQRFAPALVSFRCPECRRRIYLDPADEDRRTEDEAADQLEDDETGG